MKSSSSGTSMTAQVIYLEHVLTPHRRRIEHCKPQTIRRLAPKWQRPHIALLNGQAVMRADWGQRIKHGDTLAFVDVNAIPQGGGDGGSNPVQMVAMIAVMIYAPELAISMGFTGTALSVATVGIQMAGMMLVNALIPTPKLPTPQQATSLAAASPTYNLQAQGNQARLDAAIPEHFGRMLAYPDFAAQPYMEYAGNEQYLYQLLVVGRGEYSIEALRIEDTAIASFNEITYEVIAPGGALTLFPAEVITSVEVSGQSPSCKIGTYTRSGTTITVTLAAHGLTAGKEVYLGIRSGAGTTGTYSVVSAPTPGTFTVTDTASGTTSGDLAVSPWVGGFIANAADTSANYIGLDYVMPRGLYYANSDGSLASVDMSVTAQARTVDQYGAPTSSWALLGTETYSGATTTPLRRSKRYSVTPGRYEVRVRRVVEQQTDSRYGFDLAWTGLRAYLPEVRTFGDVTLIALRMKASNNLSMQASRKINVIATRKLPIWNGSSWSAKTATRSIAWAVAYACKQVGLTDAQIDLATLLTLDSTWTTRGDSFDARFDNFLSFWEAVTKIAGAGRAKPYMQGGVMRVMRDQAQSIPVALFTVRNIVKGSFSIDYLMPTPDTADAIDVGYFDKNVWAPRRARAKLPGSTAARPAKIELFGVVERDQAFREGMYHCADNAYRRKRPKFQTEMEGFIPSFGDLIAIQHDMPSWGQGGEVLGWNAGTKTATLSENPVFGGGTNYIAFRKLDGSVDGPYVVTAGSAGQVILGTTPAYTPYTGTAKEKTHYAFGNGSAYLLARVIAVKPNGLNRVTIEAVNEDANVHTAETGQYAPAVQTSSLTSYTSAPVVTGLLVMSAPYDPLTMLISWQPSAWASKYLIEQSSDGVNWTRIGETASSSYTAAVLYGNGTHVRVAASGSSVGPWATAVYTVTESAVPDVTSLNAVYEGTVVWLDWLPVSDPRRLLYEVRGGDAWGSGVAYQVGTQTRFKVVKDGTWWVAAKTATGVYSATPKAIRVEGAVLIDNVISSISDLDTGWAGTKEGIYKPNANSIQLCGTALFSSYNPVSAIADLALEGGFVGSGTYTIPQANRVDIGAASACQISAAMDYDVHNPITHIGGLPVFSALPSVKCPLGGTGAVALEMNLAQNDGLFSGWQPFIPGTYLARIFDFRAVLSSTGAFTTPIIRNLTTTVDVPDRIDSAQITTPAGALVTTFSKPFNNTPKMQITILDAVANDDAVVTGITSAQFTLTIKNGGASVARNVHYLAQGY